MELIVGGVLCIVLALIIRTFVLHRPTPGFGVVPAELVEAEKDGPSHEYIIGYQDMAYSVYLDEDMPMNSHLTFNAVFKDGKVCLADGHVFEFFLAHREAIKDFMPEKGRRNDEIISSREPQHWEDYYSGGVAFMDDLMAYFNGTDEKTRLIESRRQGAKELDTRFSQHSELEQFEQEMQTLIERGK